MRRLHIPVMLLLTLYLVGRYGPRLREAVSNLTEISQAQGYPAGNHYAPAENLERLDMQALRTARRKVDVCMYAFTDKFLATELLELAKNGVTVRIYRDGGEYQQEEARGGRYESTTDLFRGQSNIHIRVKPPSRRALMHLKAYEIDDALLRDGSANWSPAGLKDQDNQIRFVTEPVEIRGFERNFESLWNRPENTRVQ